MEKVFCYSDGDLAYCVDCAKFLGYDNNSKMGPNWMPFLPTTNPDEIFEKYCDRCDTCIRVYDEDKE